jgi:hypothetical protein
MENLLPPPHTHTLSYHQRPVLIPVGAPHVVHKGTVIVNTAVLSPRHNSILLYFISCVQYNNIYCILVHFTSHDIILTPYVTFWCSIFIRNL